jgi:hypothetical protein
MKSNNVLLVSVMSSDLRAVLHKVAEEDYKREIADIDEGLERYKTLILKIFRAKKWDLAIWVEGSETYWKQDEKDLDLLERSNLVRGEIKYSERARTEYREYTLTRKGTEMAEKLLETSIH